MKNILEYIFQRRSVRRFLDKEVEKEKIMLLLQAAMAAPSACNKCAWEFIVITKQDALENIKKFLITGRYNAPALIAVCGNKNRGIQGAPENYWVQECSAAMQNILLAASGLDLGAVWVGVPQQEKHVTYVSNVLQLPQHVIPVGFAYIGYPDEMHSPRTQYDESKVHWELYNATRACTEITGPQ